MQEIFSTWYVAYIISTDIVAKYSHKSVGNEESKCNIQLMLDAAI